MSKQIHHRIRFTFWLALLVIGIPLLLSLIVSPQAVLGIFRGVETPVVIEEIIRLPVNTSKSIITAYQYSGYVRITIRGEGKINSNTRHDAFYQFNADGSVEGFNGFKIDGEGLILRVFVQAPISTNRSEHEYEFLYSVGTEARQISFSMMNDNAQDTSEFLLEISNKNVVGSSGR